MNWRATPFARCFFISMKVETNRQSSIDRLLSLSHLKAPSEIRFNPRV